MRIHYNCDHLVYEVARNWHHLYLENRKKRLKICYFEIRPEYECTNEYNTFAILYFAYDT